MGYRVLGISIQIVIQDTGVDKSTKQNHVDKKDKRTLIENPEEYQHIKQAIVGHTKLNQEGHTERQEENQESGIMESKEGGI